MTFNNAMKVYLALAAIHTPDKKTKPMPMCISELAHCYMQCGPAMRRQKAKHPKPACSVTLAFDTGSRCKICADAKKVNTTMQRVRTSGKIVKRTLQREKKKHEWMCH